MDAYQRLGLKAAGLAGGATLSLARNDFEQAYIQLAQSLNLQKMLGGPPDLADRTAALMTEIATAAETTAGLRKAEIARLKEQIARLESQTAQIETETALSAIRNDWSKK